MSLVLFKRSFRSECVDFGLPILRPLLQVSQTLHLALLLFSGCLLLGLDFLFAHCLEVVVLDDLELEVSFFLFALVLGFDGLAVGLFDFDHHALGRLALFLEFAGLFASELLDLFENELLFAFPHFLFADAFELSLFDLVDDDERALLESVFALPFEFVLVLEVLETLDLHHQVESALFVPVLAFETLLFAELFVSNCDAFRVKTHLVYLFDFVFLFVEHVLRILQQSGFLSVRGDLELVWRDFAGPLLVHRDHALYASFGSALLLFDLFVEHFLGEFLFFFGHDFSRAFDAFEFGTRKDDGVCLETYLGLFSDLPELSERNDGYTWRRHSCLRPLIFSTEQRFINIGSFTLSRTLRSSWVLWLNGSCYTGWHFKWFFNLNFRITHKIFNNNKINISSINLNIINLSIKNSISNHQSKTILK